MDGRRRPSPLRKGARNARIREEVARGRTYQEVADEFGVSRQRVDQIVKPRRANARSELNKAIKDGRVSRPDECPRCGGAPVEAHHPDYSRPLDVEWMCVACHREEHRGDPKRVPNRMRPELRTCAGCGEPHIRKPSSKAKYCSRRCAGRAKRLPNADRVTRFAQAAQRLRAFVRRHGYVPGVVEFAMEDTGRDASSAVATLVNRCDPSRIMTGSYAAAADYLYRQAGFVRPDGRQVVGATNEEAA